MLENLKEGSSNKYKNYRTALKHLTSPYIKYMNPQISKENAEKIVTNYLKESENFREKEKIKSKIKKLKLENRI